MDWAEDLIDQGIAVSAYLWEAIENLQPRPQARMDVFQCLLEVMTDEIPCLYAQDLFHSAAMMAAPLVYTTPEYRALWATRRDDAARNFAQYQLDDAEAAAADHWYDENKE